MGERKITLVLTESDANLLAAAVGAGAVSWDMQGAKAKAKTAIALRDRILTARRYDHGSSTRQSTRLLRRG